ANFLGRAHVYPPVRHAFRRLVGSPVFALTALITLGVAIGANALIFSVVNGVLLKPLPFAAPDQLVGVWHFAPGIMAGDLNQAPSTYLTYREAKVFQDIGMWRDEAASVTGHGEPERVDTLRLTQGTLDLLGVRPEFGRIFTPEDDTYGSAPTVILGHDYWQRVFGGNPNALQQSLVIDGTPTQVVGILPAGFRFLNERPALVLPFQLNRAELFVGNFSYYALARLKPGGSIEQASADIARLIPGIPDHFPMPPGFSREMYNEVKLAPNVKPLLREVVGDIGNILWVLLGAVGIVLLVACANIANLFLVRAEGRQQELAVRSALGASRWQVIGELLAEAFTLSTAAGLLGLALAYGGIRLLLALSPSRLPRLDEIALDPIVVVMVLVASLFAALLFGLIPIAKYTNPQVSTTLKEGGRGSSDGRERHRARHTLVVAQVALALVLLVASGLMIRTFLAMRNVEPGFTAPDDVFTMRIAIPDTVVKDPLQAAATHEQILQRLEAIPGVTSVGLTSSMPMDGLTSHDPVWLEDKPAPEGQMPALRRFKWVSPKYFSTVGTRLIAGRDFTWDDLHNQQFVAVISDALAREYWGSAAAALGKRIRQSPKNPWREVVGVVADVRDDGVSKAEVPTVYWPMTMKQFWDQDIFVQRWLSYAVRTPRVRTAGFIKDVQQAVWGVNPNLPLARPRTLGDIYKLSMAETSFALVIIGIAGGVTLLLGLVGLYGVIAYIVAQRRREVGIRMALGAAGADVQRMFVRSGLQLAGIGMVVGIGVALAVSRFLASLLFGVSPFDPVTYGAVAVALGGVALVATWLPARQASMVEPAIALRSE
ncbi:MAG TPA: ABC transporter permease, partial [Vicinamibacterales bacterium]|nr:ABC transporter permease [Vicinamibacterales bacterium]